MKTTPRFWRRLGLAFGLILLVVAVAGIWGVPALIRGQLRSRYGGRVAFSGWWLGAKSAGVKGLALHEGPGRDTPVWARAARVETNLTPGRMLRGQFSPDRITLVRPRITFRLGPDGEPLTRPPLKSAGGEASVPEVVVKDGQVTIRQEPGREMVVGPVEARLQTENGGEALRAETDDPVWGRWTATGRFEPGFGTGRIVLTSVGDAILTPAKTAMIPFVPAVVWEHLDPRGAVRVAIDVTTGSSPRVRTTGDFSGATLRLPSLGLVAEDARGRVAIDGRIVTLSGVTGRAIGGTVSASGTLDFEASPPRFDLALVLNDVDVTRTPASWQLAESGITGRLTGKARLRVALTKGGADLTGSEGSAVVEQATIGGIDVKTLKLAMKAAGDELKYETGATSAMTGAGGSPSALSLEAVREAGFEIGDSRSEMGIGGDPPGIGGWDVPNLGSRISDPESRIPNLGSRIPGGLPLLALIALRTPPIQDKPPPARARTGGFLLPKTLSTEVEFEDVDLVQIVARARALGIPLPFAVAGRLSLKAKATIPLGSLREVKDYAFHGRATLKGASIDGVDLGVVSARLDLDRGVLDLTEFHGRLADHPAGGVANPPPATDPTATDAPLPSGGFRGRLHAEIAPLGALSARFEGKDVPLGELAAPALPKPTPLSGLASFRFDASADMAHLDDPKRWAVSGKADAARIAYRGATLDRVSTSVALKDGRASLPDFAALLGGHPMKAALAVDVQAPFAFNGRLDVADWDLDAILAFIPSLPRPAPVSGAITMKAEASGALEPRDVAMQGDGVLHGFRAGPVTLGDVPVRWRTVGDLIRVEMVQARPFGGSISAAAEVPVKGDGPVKGSAAIEDVDVGLVSSLVPGGALAMTGRADGKGTFTIRPSPKDGEAPIEANLALSAPDLTVQGVAAKGLQAALSVRGGDLKYSLSAESLGGKVRFRGAVPLSSAPEADGRPPEATGSFQAVGFRLEGLWASLGVGGALAKLEGLAAIDANLAALRSAADLRARGRIEIRDLRWGENYPIGVVKGTVAYAPGGWKIDPLSGDVLGGSAHGSVVAARPEPGPAAVRFNLGIDRALMKRALAFIPAIGSEFEGEGSLRLAGRLAESLRADGEAIVATATFHGLPVRELRAPVDLEYSPGGPGALHVRRWAARFAGGRMTGDARFGFGAARGFQVDTRLSAIDVETLARVLTDARRPASGKISGSVGLHGPDPRRIDQFRGRIDLDLDDASLVELPVFRELDRFLGAARGGVFEDGDLHATIANRQVVVEGLTLNGRLVQLHAAGTVGFDTRLDLVAIINTNQIISQTGQALVGLIPVVTESSGRRAAPSSRFASFLSNRLLKFRVTGTLGSPSVNLDPAVAVSEAAVGFFAGVMKLPLDLLR